MQLEDITLSEVSQVQKDKRPPVFADTYMTDPKINIYTKTSMILHKLRCRTGL
jgi:hypothetical protein